MKKRRSKNIRKKEIGEEKLNVNCIEGQREEKKEEKKEKNRVEKNINGWG